jgi:four helix bundle protein
MKNNVVKDKSYAFALRTIKLYKHLSEVKKEYILSKQILKSGTSIGANIEEADAAISRADFSSKISIAYKEARETRYWLRLLLDSSYLDKNSFDSIFVDADELCKLLFTILKSSGRIKQ